MAIQSLLTSGATGSELNDAALEATGHLRLAIAAAS